MSTNTHAWEFKEHRELGETSYLEACSTLDKIYNAPQDSELLAILKSLPCINADERARQYGIRTALSADHIESPEDFETEVAEEQALSWVNYGSLALKNHEHFWPHVKYMWRRYHDQAIGASLRAREYWDDNRKIKAVVELERALALSSFADHFLHDAFSIGHGGFSRINSFQNSSLIFHDEWNNSGRWMKGNRYDLNRYIGSERMLEESILNPPTSCDSVVDSLSGLVIKKRDSHCDVDIWYAYGDGKLKDNPQNSSRIIEANKNAIVAVILSFVEGDDRGFSLLADNQFPISTQSFEQKSAYAGLLNDNGERYVISQLKNDKCPQAEGGVYSQFNVCWFDVESSYMEPVYSDMTAVLGKVIFDGYDSSFYSLYLAYSLYSPTLPFLNAWPKNIRIYYLFNLEDADISYENSRVSTYRELGLNIVLPNLYDGTLLSHDIDIAYALLDTQQEKWYKNPEKNEEGGYLGVNTNFDIMKAKLSLGLGWFFPTTDLSDSEFKAQIMVGWDFGVLGGGPLSRWKE